MHSVLPSTCPISWKSLLIPDAISITYPSTGASAVSLVGVQAREIWPLSVLTTCRFSGLAGRSVLGKYHRIKFHSEYSNTVNKGIESMCSHSVIFDTHQVGDKKNEFLNLDLLQHNEHDDFID